MELKELEAKLEEIAKAKDELVKKGNSLSEELTMIKRNLDGYDGAIFMLNELIKGLKDKEVPNKCGLTSGSIF